MINLNTLYKNSGTGVCGRHSWLAIIITNYNAFVLRKTLAQGGLLDIGTASGKQKLAEWWFQKTFAFLIKIRNVFIPLTLGYFSTFPPGL